jgi:flagellar hook-associated protein 2
VVNSANPSAISGTATREAAEQEYSFTVRQIAKADRFLSDPLEDSFKVDEGTYTFSIGQQTITFPFRGGSLREFTETLNRRGRDKIGASLISVQAGKKSLLIESKITGAENRLVFLDAAETLGVTTGILGETSGSTAIPLNKENALKVEAGGSAFIPLDKGSSGLSRNVQLRYEVATEVFSAEDTATSQEAGEERKPNADEVLSSGTIPSWTPLAELPKQPEPPQQTQQNPRVDTMEVLYLTFADGTNRALPPIKDSEDFSSYQYRLLDIAGGKNIASIEVINKNTNRHVSIRNIQLFDPDVAEGNIRARNPVSEAQDAILTMEGIEVARPSNTIGDLIPGVTITPKAPSEDKPIRIAIEPDRQTIKDSIISLVANYNRLMADINVLTRNDDRVVQELSYLSQEEQAELRKRMGAFSGDSILGQFRSTLQRVATAPYHTSEDQEMALLAQIGIGTDVRGSGSGGYDPARLRGYLEIDEKALDTALETKLPFIQQLFGYDTDGDFVVDSGVAHALETITKPYTEIGGVIALKTGTIDSRISQENRRIDTLDRQLAAKEAALKSQYSQMEGAYTRMERMTSSLDQFSTQNSGSK